MWKKKKSWKFMIFQIENWYLLLNLFQKKRKMRSLFSPRHSISTVSNFSFFFFYIVCKSAQLSLKYTYIEHDYKRWVFVSFSVSYLFFSSPSVFHLFGVDKMARDVSIEFGKLRIYLYMHIRTMCGFCIIQRSMEIT